MVRSRSVTGLVVAGGLVAAALIVRITQTSSAEAVRREEYLHFRVSTSTDQTVSLFTVPPGRTFLLKDAWMVVGQMQTLLVDGDLVTYFRDIHLTGGIPIPAGSEVAVKDAGNGGGEAELTGILIADSPCSCQQERP